MLIDIRILFSGDVYYWIYSWIKNIFIINVMFDKFDSLVVYFFIIMFVILVSKVLKNFEEY